MKFTLNVVMSLLIARLVATPTKIIPTLLPTAQRPLQVSNLVPLCEALEQLRNTFTALSESQLSVLMNGCNIFFISISINYTVFR